MSYHDCRFDSGAGADRARLTERILNGEVFVYREALQAFDLFGMLTQASLRGIAASVGQEAADRAARDGFHRIHEWVPPEKIPAMTDAVYDAICPLAQVFLDRFMAGAFPAVANFYYQRTPNVRFHIPYDIAEPHKKEFNAFARRRGPGKIAAHGPHRDSWLDCPANGINLWFALGRTRPGNGMTIYPQNYQGEFVIQNSGNIADGQTLNRPWTFDLQPGDVIMFHTDHVHGSELNRTNETRFAISCRLTIDKPEFRRLHYQEYIHAGWKRSRILRPFAMLPAKLQLSYFSSLVRRLRNKAMPAMAPGAPQPPPAENIGTQVGELVEVPLDRVEAGSVHGVSGALCVARLSETKVVAMSRRCPHAGADLANGWVDGQQLVCPWHNLPFDTATGKSPCKVLPALQRVQCEIVGDKIVINPRVLMGSE